MRHPNCASSKAAVEKAIERFRANAFEPMYLNDFVHTFGEVYAVHFTRYFVICKDKMVRVRSLRNPVWSK